MSPIKTGLYPGKIAFAVAVALASPLTLFAQEGNQPLEVIMVTAQKRVQSVKEVPLSISAISQEKLLENNISDTVELSAHIANFSVSETAQGFNVIMRGLGSGTNQGFEQTVGTYVDGIYRGRAHLMRSAFLDLERVEVLRGPQSTLFGKNTTAGALNLTSAKPSEDLQGYLNTSYDFDFNASTLEAAVSNSLTDTLQARVALKYVEGGGYIENTVTGEDEMDHESWQGRLTLAWQPTSTLDVTLALQHDKDDLLGFSPSQPFVEPAIAASGAPILGALQDVVFDDKVHKTSPALGEKEQADFEADHLTLNIEYDLDDLVLTATSGWQRYELTQSNDGDHSALPLVYRPLGNEKFAQFSQELRLTSALAGPFNYIAGAYYQNTDLDYDEDFLVYPLASIGERNFTVDSDTLAVFTQLDYQFSRQWQATLGLRYSREDKDGYRQLVALDPATRTPIVEMPLVQAPAIAEAFPDGLPGAVYSAVVLAGQNIFDHQVQNSRKENNFTPSLNIRYQLDDAMFYAAISKGNKAGGFDARSNNPDDFEFDDEEVTAIELGAKFTLDDGLADLNLALFTMNFEDLQTSIFDGSTGFFVENGGEATTMGLEVDGRWQFADHWLVSGSLGWLDFEWDEFKGAKCFSSVTIVPDNIEAGGASCDNSGKTNAFAPDLSGSLNLEYYTEIGGTYGLKASIDVIYKDDYFTNTDLNPFTMQEAYTKVNARVALLDDVAGWQVALLVKNLTDKTTVSFSTDMPLMGPGFYAGWVEPGRSVSLQLSYRFD